MMPKRVLCCSGSSVRIKVLEPGFRKSEGLHGYPKQLSRLRSNQGLLTSCTKLQHHTSWHRAQSCLQAELLAWIKLLMAWKNNKHRSLVNTATIPSLRHQPIQHCTGIITAHHVTSTRSMSMGHIITNINGHYRPSLAGRAVTGHHFVTSPQ